ncbi:cupin domain-containing protein [Beijerinckia mobilis]|uniref:cupin domain-containing protein n=1 Tax=Beijerinckia mobilis TaxID=231434 RepID=UPI000692456A|nr:cupin domain-containing protein [Beijerinckia mobilis]
MTMAEPTAQEIIATLDLLPHPEGGYYRETFRDPLTDGAGRSRSSLIYFLLPAGEISAWHRIDAVETWHFYAGAPLELRIAEAGVTATHRLGTDLLAGEAPQVIVPPFAWQSARSLGAWTVVGCSVAPAFQFSEFEMADPGWEPEHELPKQGL